MVFLNFACREHRHVHTWEREHEGLIWALRVIGFSHLGPFHRIESRLETDLLMSFFRDLCHVVSSDLENA